MIGSAAKTEALERAVKGRSLGMDAWVRLKRNRAAMAAITVLTLMTLMAIFAPFLSPFRYDAINYDLVTCAPSWWPGPSSCIASGHIFGTDAVGPVVVYVTLTVPAVILTESFLSFLGLGVQEPLTSWGTLISEGAAQMETATWTLVFPALFMAVTLFCFNFIGDGLRDALDPRDR